MSAAQQGATVTVLIVDDAIVMRRMIGDILLNSGRYTCVGEAGDGAEAIRLFEDLRPSVVVMDLTMPVMDGISATREILRRHPEARVVMCSTTGQEGKVVDALDAGARDFILKPFTAETVLRALDGL